MWARVENAACARRLWAIADMLERRLGADGSADREQWCLDNWDAICAEVGAAQNVSLGVASHQLLVAMALRERLPRVGEVFTAGAIGLRMVTAIVYRTGLITDPDAQAKVDTQIAAVCVSWGSLSVAKIEAAIDSWVDRYDPHALRRTQTKARDRHVDVVAPRDGTGLATVEATLFAHDAEALDQRLDAMTHTVCDGDPRTMEQRRSDALGAWGRGADRLTCGCDNPDCDAATAQQTGAVVVYVIAEQTSLRAHTDVQLDGTTAESIPTPADDRRPRRRPQTPQTPQTPRPPSPQTPSVCAPGLIMGGALIPAPLLAATIATDATIVPIMHPGQAPPEPRYTPSAALATFIRCRDLTCRFPGCDEPAQYCDVDHTIAYPVGPTQASNLKCVCRKHHLLKTFWGWRDEQSPDATVVWTSPNGQTYTTHPGSRPLFPTLCTPTAPVTAEPTDAPDANPARTLKMPRRTQTRTQDRAKRINTERQLNNDHAAERNKPPLLLRVVGHSDGAENELGRHIEGQ